MAVNFLDQEKSASSVRTTLFEMMIGCCSDYRDKLAFIYNIGEEEFQVKYSKLFEDVVILARAFRNRGVSKGDKIMLLSDNRYAWIVTDMAIMSIGAVSVPRGSDTPTQELQFIIEDSGCTYLVIESDRLLSDHEEYVKKCKQLKTVFVMEGLGIHKMFSSLYAYNDLLSDRKLSDSDVLQFLKKGQEIMPEDDLTIIYTSGTTGNPKGVILAHSNVMHNVRHLPGIIKLSPDDRWLSILPSWHIFERTAEYVALAGGSTIVYSTIKTFSKDLEHYQPTLVATVPRVWESLYSRVQSALKKQGGQTQKIFDSLIWISAAYRRNYRRLKSRMPKFKKTSFFENAVEKSIAFIKISLLYLPYQLARKKLSKVQDRFGGKLRLAISGGGTLASYLEEWIDAVGIRIVNAYGMTECSPAIAGRALNCRIYGTLGPPVEETELRIVSEDGDILGPGEEGLIEVRGPQVTKGYYNNEEENQKSFTEDGFFRTGDLGKMTISGELIITGRAKEIIVLASGENIDPTRIEDAISRFPFIKDAVLVGQDKKGLGALLVPNIDEFKEYVAAKFSHLTKDKEELLKDRAVLNQIRGEMNRLLKPKQGFKPYEKLQDIVFIQKEFKLGEELTNTLKKKRHVIEKKYKEIINNLLH